MAGGCACLLIDSKLGGGNFTGSAKATRMNLFPACHLWEIEMTEHRWAHRRLILFMTGVNVFSRLFWDTFAGGEKQGIFVSINVSEGNEMAWQKMARDVFFGAIKTGRWVMTNCDGGWLRRFQQFCISSLCATSARAMKLILTLVRREWWSFFFLPRLFAENSIGDSREVWLNGPPQLPFVLISFVIPWEMNWGEPVICEDVGIMPRFAWCCCALLNMNKSVEPGEAWLWAASPAMPA